MTAVYVDYIVILRRIARYTGVPVRQLSDWRKMGLLILSAVLGAAVAWSIVQRYFSDSGPLVRLISGGVVLAAVYAAMVALVGAGRGWLTAIRDSGPGL